MQNIAWTYVPNQFKYNYRPNACRLFNKGKQSLNFPFITRLPFHVCIHYLSLLSWLTAISTFRTRGVQHIRWEGSENSLKSRYSLNECTRSTKHPKYILHKTSMLVDYASLGRSVFAYNVTQCLQIIAWDLNNISHLEHQTHSSIG